MSLQLDIEINYQYPKILISFFHRDSTTVRLIASSHTVCQCEAVGFLA